MDDEASRDGTRQPMTHEDSDVDILMALAGLDESSNQSTTQATVNIIAVVMAYYAATLFAISTTDIVRQLPLAILLLVPLPVLLLQMLQMNWTSGAVRRTASLERIEEHLFMHTRLSEDYKKRLVGVQVTTRVTDIRYLGDSGWKSRVLIIAGVLAYPGFWLLSMGYIGYVIFLGWHRVMQDAPTVGDLITLFAFAFGYALLVSLFVAAALAAFMPSKKA